MTDKTTEVVDEKEWNLIRQALEEYRQIGESKGLYVSEIEMAKERIISDANQMWEVPVRHDGITRLDFINALQTYSLRHDDETLLEVLDRYGFDKNQSNPIEECQCGDLVAPVSEDYCSSCGKELGHPDDD